MPKNDLVKDTELAADPLAAMGVDDEQLRRAGRTQQLTTAWFCTMYSAMSRCCP